MLPIYPQTGLLKKLLAVAKDNQSVTFRVPVTTPGMKAKDTHPPIRFKTGDIQGAIMPYRITWEAEDWVEISQEACFLVKFTVRLGKKFPERLK